MAANSEFNWLGQQRVDISHLRMLESGVRYDLDSLAYMLVGEGGYIVKGFELLTGAVGDEVATSITIKVAGSKVIHPLASESGSVFSVPSNRANEILNPQINPRMSTGFQAGSTNYVGIDLKRAVDPTTSDIVQFMAPPDTVEFSQKVPLRRTLDYVWIISQTDFTYNQSVIPVLIVETNTQNQIDSIQDARSLLGRLTPGGDVASEVNPYGWPGGRPDNTLTSAVSNAGDKALTSVKTWMNAMMTRMWELGGGEQWFSVAADRNVNLHTGTTVFASTGESFEVVAGNLHWQGISFGFDNSSQFTLAIADQTTDLAGLTDLASGECIYADLDRTSTGTVTAQKGLLTTLGGSTKPGQRWVICSRIGNFYYVSGQPWPVGSSFSLATTVHAGAIRTNLDYSPADPVAATIVTSPGPDLGTVTGAGLSHNRDMGSVRLYDSNGDIRIGRGNAAGDNSVIIRTDQANKGTYILGAGTSVPYMTVDAVPGTAIPSAVVLSLNSGSNAVYVDCSLSAKTITYLPLPPISSEVKYFMKQNKTWKGPVRLRDTTIADGAYTYDSVAKTLTSNSYAQPIFDGVTAIEGDGVLVDNPGFAGNGLYEVTTVGSGVPVLAYSVLTKRIDAGGPGSVELLGYGFDIFDGVAVEITDGIDWADYYAVLDAPQVAEAVDLSVYSWSSTNTMTSDEFCVMWSDGSYTVIASGPEYTVGLS